MRGPAKTAYLAVIFSALIAPGCLEDLLEFVPDDSYEPNNSIAQAEPITDSTTFTDAFMIFDSIDHYVFTTSGAGNIEVLVTPLGWGADCTAALLLDDGVTEVGTVVVAGDLITITHNGVGSAETFYIRVERADGATGGPYGLAVSVS